jgi:hypothetical protein
MSDGRTRSRTGTLTAAIAAALTAAFLAAPALAQADGTISGEVTTQLTEAPIKDVRVCAINQGIQGCGKTEEDGTYTIARFEGQGLEAGEYAIWFSPPAPYVPEFYDNHTAPELSDPVEVKDTAVTGINAKLQTRGAITGAVTDASTNAPIAGAEVCAFTFYCDQTATDGSYAIEGLLPDEYAVNFTAPGYVSQYYNGKRKAEEANLVAVQPEQIVPNINAKLFKPAPPAEEPPPTQSQPPPPYPTIASQQTSTPHKRKRCRKGFRRKKVRGHYRCVRRHPRRRAHRKQRAHRRHSHHRRAQRRDAR